jgi:hypothetical protein
MYRHNKYGSKRTHCRFKIYNLIMYALKTENPKISGLCWIIPNNRFAINYKKFTDYYIKTGHSSSQLTSIKNRMTKSKSGFVAINNDIPPDDYDKIYTHNLWPDTPTPTFNINIENIEMTTSSIISNTTETQNISNTTETQNISNTFCGDTNSNQTQHIDKESGNYINIFNNIFIPEIIPVTILNKNPINAWNTFQFCLSHFLNEMRSIQNLHMTDFDKINFEILLLAEMAEFPCEKTADKFTDILPTCVLHNFGVRFGPWTRIIENVREFVSNGAKDWFYGKCDTATANDILSKYNDPLKNNHEYFLIRAVDNNTPPATVLTIPDLKYVFAISYCKTKENQSNIAHQKIYKDKLDRLCLINNANELIFFPNFSGIIQQILKDPYPISNAYFNNLIINPPQKIFINDINEPGFERLVKT